MLAGGVPSIPAFRPTPRTVFADRAARLSALASGHAMEGYLQFAALLARAQDEELGRFPEVSLPEAVQLERCREHGLPPLSIDAPRDRSWHDGLMRLLEALQRSPLPAQATRTLTVLREDGTAALERDAANLLAGAHADIDPARVPFVAAALQVHWTKMALALGEDATSAGVDFRVCPVCGSPPVVSVVRSGGAEQGLRYLVCSLCASEWHLVRVKCSSCGSTKGISYLFVEGANDAVKAECCEECKTYLKILYLDQDHRMEPLADDLATLALDVLVDEQGYQRLGPNLLLSPGSDV